MELRATHLYFSAMKMASVICAALHSLVPLRNAVSKLSLEVVMDLPVVSKVLHLVSTISTWTCHFSATHQFTDALREPLDHLLDRSSNVKSVSIDNVHIWLLHALQRALQTLDNVLLAKTSGIGLLASSTEEHLGRKHILVARPGKLLESLAHLDLGSTIGVRLSSIEEVTPVAPSSGEAVFDNASLLRATVGTMVRIISVAAGFSSVKDGTDSHPPREKTDTLRPVGPRLRKIISLGSNFDSTAMIVMRCLFTN